MAPRLLVPLDGSATAESVLPHVKRLLRRDAEVVLVRAIPVPLSRRGVPPLRPEEREERRYLARAASLLEDVGFKVKAVVALGDPAEVILETASAEAATLIVMATHGSTGLRRALFGSVAEAVLRASPVPVLIVHPFVRQGLLKPLKVANSPIRRILVPVDPDAFVSAALPAVTEWAEHFDATIVLIHAMDSAKGAQLERLRSISDPLEKRGIPVDFRFQEGDPVQSILRVSEQEDVDVIAMASHGRRGLSRLLKGSVTETVLRKSERPLLVVHVARKRAARRRKPVESPR